MARETLSRDQIVTAALELLDAEGLEGMNMRALGVQQLKGRGDDLVPGKRFARHEATLGHPGPDLNNVRESSCTVFKRGVAFFLNIVQVESEGWKEGPGCRT